MGCLEWDDAVAEHGQLLATCQARHINDPAIRQGHHPLHEAGGEPRCAAPQSGLRGEWCGAAEKLLVGADRILEFAPAVTDRQNFLPRSAFTGTSAVGGFSPSLAVGVGNKCRSTSCRCT